MIKGTNGLPYRAAGEYQQFDPEDQELCLFNLWDEEAIRIGGSPIFYYELFIQSSTTDPVYLEDRGKLWSNNPIQLYCNYEPIGSQNSIGAFGIDSPDEMIFEFNYHSMLQKIGHPPKVGSRLFTPHLRENWIIIQNKLQEFKLWGALRINVLAQRFQESTTTGEGKVTQKMPDFKIP